MDNPILSGERFGAVVAELRIAELRIRRNWLCKCDCGRQFLTRGIDLRRGKTRSCGCQSSRQTMGQRMTTHGKSTTKIYRRWSAILARCRNPKVKTYHNYGGRGIKVCERWHCFENFLADMGMPEPGMTIERLDNDGDYTPENCVWATRKAQSNNRRYVHRLKCSGDTHTITEWADLLGVPRKTLYGRLKKGWPIERVLIRDQNSVSSA